jgi:indolepyruvate ferredoxin oxidoreductase
LAAKDEYEVARLYADPAFARSVEAAFEGDYRVAFHFGWSIGNGGRSVVDVPRKRRFGPWFIVVLRALARLRGLRGTWLDPFRRRPERARDRLLIAEYERTVEELLAVLDRDNWAQAVAAASVAETIRGFGPVRMESATEANARLAHLLEEFHAARSGIAAA